jgi:hypothetical protein
VSPRRSARAVALVVGLAFAACRRAEPSPTPSANDSAPPAGATTGSAISSPSPLPPALVEAGADASSRAEVEAAAAAPFLVGVPTSARSIGHTSIVFKVELSTGKKAAWKPASRRGPVRYKGEIAAYRLARLLQLTNVPPAFFRTFEATTLAAAKGADEMIVSNGLVKGALIPWIPELSFLALEQAPLSGEWKAWLRRGSTIPDDKRELARQISTLVAFDYMTGNWDRWSGGNVGLDKATGSLLFIDNDGAFFEVAPEEGLQRNKKLLAGVDRFSSGLVKELRYLEDAEIMRALGEESSGVPLLSQKALAGVFRRRAELLEVVDAKLKAGGEAETYLFP